MLLPSMILLAVKAVLKWRRKNLSHKVMAVRKLISHCNVPQDDLRAVVYRSKIEKHCLKKMCPYNCKLVAILPQSYKLAKCDDCQLHMSWALFGMESMALVWYPALPWLLLEQVEWAGSTSCSGDTQVDRDTHLNLVTLTGDSRGLTGDTWDTHLWRHNLMTLSGDTRDTQGDPDTHLWWHSVVTLEAHWGHTFVTLGTQNAHGTIIGDIGGFSVTQVVVTDFDAQRQSLQTLQILSLRYMTEQISDTF